jgi:hypothetical protein
MKINTNSIGCFCLLFLIFLISPIAGAISGFVVLLFFHQDKYRIFSAFFFIALFLGALNICKVPESDMANYIDEYQQIPFYRFTDYLFIKQKEPVFYFFNYCIYHIFFGSVSGYIMVCSVVSYMLIFYSLWKMHIAMGLNKYNFMIAIAVAVLFPNIFSISAHLMRQFLAESLILYVVVEYVFYSKRKIIPFLLAVFTHTSSALMGVVFIPFFKRKLTRKNILLVAVCAVAVGSLLFKFAGYFVDMVDDSNSVLLYGLNRLSDRKNAWQTDNISILMILLYAITLIIFYFAAKKISIKISALFYLTLILLVFVLVNYNDTEIALRFSFYLYFFVPFAFYFLPNVLKIKDKNMQHILFSSITLLFLCWFIYKLNYGTWTYINLESLTNFLWIKNF